MNYSFNGFLQFQSSATLTGQELGLSALEQTTTLGKIQRFNNGTGTGNCTQSYSQLIQLLPGQGTNLSLQSLTGNLNTATNMTAAKGLVIQVLSLTDPSSYGTNCTSVFVGNASANGAFTGLGQNGWWGPAANGGVRCFGGGFLTFTNPSNTGCPITNTSNTLRIQNEDASNNASIYLSIMGLGTGG